MLKVISSEIEYYSINALKKWKVGKKQNERKLLFSLILKLFLSLFNSL